MTKEEIDRAVKFIGDKNLTALNKMGELKPELLSQILDGKSREEFARCQAVGEIYQLLLSQVETPPDTGS